MYSNIKNNVNLKQTRGVCTQNFKNNSENVIKKTLESVNRIYSKI